MTVNFGMMTRTCGFASITLVCLALASGARAAVLTDAARGDWAGERLTRELDDGSVMTEYLANTVALGRADALLTVAFTPRFECTPLIGIRIDSSLSDDPERTTALLRSLQPLDDGDRLNLDVDQKRVTYPVLVDHGANSAALWYGRDREDRETLTLQMDGGDNAQIALSTSTTLEFSLQGSRASMLAARRSCLRHEPVPYQRK